MTQFRTLATGIHPVRSYQVLLELGRGGMGSVHLARTVGVGGFERLVVVKRLLPHLLQDAEAVERFLGEARNAACVHHAHVVGIHQVGQDQDGYFLLQDYVEGASLDEVVQRSALRRRRVPVRIVLRVALDALAGLAAVHEARDPMGRALGMLHRDMSLENLLVGCDGVTRVADFGIAKTSRSSVETGHNVLVGKLLYLAPECLRREPIGATLDIYGLGMSLWLALASREPWPEVSEAQLVQHILNGLPTMDPQLGIAPEIEALVARACHLDPAQRFPSARAMGRALEELGKGTDLIGTHGDVSDYLQTLMGVDLVRRRQRVGQRIESLAKEGVATHTSLPPPSDREEAPPRGSDPAPAPPLLWRPARVGWVAAAVVAGAVALWWATGRHAVQPPPSTPSPITQAPAPPAPQPSAALPVAAPAAAPPVVAPVAAPEATTVVTPVEAARPGPVAPAKERARDAVSVPARERAKPRTLQPAVDKAPPSGPPAVPEPTPSAPRTRTGTSELEVPPDWQE